MSRNPVDYLHGTLETLVLKTLTLGPKHGYAIMIDVAAFAGVKLGPGTLYTAITRLVERKLITAQSGEGRQRPYRLTAQGATVLTSQLNAMKRVAAASGAIRSSGTARIRFTPSTRRDSCSSTLP